jgi:hypothetical protein
LLLAQGAHAELERIGHCTPGSGRAEVAIAS